MWRQLARYWGNLSRGSCYLIRHEFYPLSLLVEILASMRPSNSTHPHPNHPSAPHTPTFPSPLFRTTKINTPLSKLSSQGRSFPSSLCNPLSFISSSEISSNFHYWQTWCFLVACHLHTTGTCRQEKYSCYATVTGLLCSFTGRRLAAECHTPPYHGLRAGSSIHVMHCVSWNFPGCGGESCCLLSELCQKSYSFS